MGCSCFITSSSIFSLLLLIVSTLIVLGLYHLFISFGHKMKLCRYIRQLTRKRKIVYGFQQREAPMQWQLYERMNVYEHNKWWCVTETFWKQIFKVYKLQSVSLTKWGICSGSSLFPSCKSLSARICLQYNFFLSLRQKNIWFALTKSENSYKRQI